MNPAGYPYVPLPARPRGTWPNGTRLAVVVCVGIESYRFGEGFTEDVLADVPAPDLVNTAWRDYGNRVGAFRLFDLLGRLGIPPTVLLNTDVYDEAPTCWTLPGRSPPRSWGTAARTPTRWRGWPRMPNGPT